MTCHLFIAAGGARLGAPENPRAFVRGDPWVERPGALTPHLPHAFDGARIGIRSRFGYLGN